MHSFFKCRLLAIESDTFFSQSFEVIFEGATEISYVGSVPFNRDCISEIHRAKVNIVLWDIDAPFGGNVLDVLRETKVRFPQLLIAVISSRDDYQFVSSILRCGVSAYFTRDIEPAMLIHGVAELKKGGGALSSAIARKIVLSFHRRSKSNLTNREREILALLTKGNSTTQIANLLHVSCDTSKSHIRNIYKKLEVRKKSDAIAYARQLL